MVRRQTTHELTAEALLILSCSYALIIDQLYQKKSKGGGEGKTDSGSVFKDNFIQLWGGELTHQTFRTENCFSCAFNGHIITEMKVFFFVVFFIQPDGTDSWTDWEVTGSTAALLHTGESFYWWLSSKISPAHPL